MNNRIHSENRRASLAHRLALAPYSVWAVIFVAVPLVFVAYYAFTDESFRFTTENLTQFFTAVSTITDDRGAARDGRSRPRRPLRGGPCRNVRRRDEGPRHGLRLRDRAEGGL